MLWSRTIPRNFRPFPSPEKVWPETLQQAAKMLWSKTTIRKFSRPANDGDQRFSWLDHDVYSPVRRQICDTCQSNSIVACMEMGYQICFGQRVLLSVEEFVAMGRIYGLGDKRFLNHSDAAYYAKKFGVGLHLDYLKNKKDGKRVKIAEVYRKRNLTSLGLKAAILRQPVSAAMFNIGSEFGNYKGGYYRNVEKISGTGPPVGHAVVAIGWVYHGGELYFEIQNSSGTEWGYRGYGFVHHSRIDIPKTCILTMKADYYPIAKSSTEMPKVEVEDEWIIETK